MRVRIEIDTKTFVRFWLVIVGLVLLGYALYSAKTALIVISTAAFLAICLSRPVNRFVEWVPGHSRLGGTAVVFGCVSLFLGIVITALVPAIVDQTVRVASTVPYLLDRAQESWPVFNEFVALYQLEGYVLNAIDSLRQSTDSFAYAAGSSALTLMGSFAKLLIASILTFFLTFLMLLEGPRWIRSLWDLYEDVPKRELHKSQAKRMQAVIAGFVTGQVVLAGLSALTSSLVIFALHYVFPMVPLGLVLPAIAIVFVFSLIPMFGPIVAGVFVAGLLAFSDIVAASVFAVFFVLYQQLQRSVVAPVLQTKVVEITPLLVLISVVTGYYMFGLVGAIIAVPIAGCIKVVVEDYLHHTKKMRSIHRFSAITSVKSFLKNK